MPPRLRLADLIAGLSVASDLGFGLSTRERQSARCLVATALARTLDLPESKVADTYYASLLLPRGLSRSLSHETANTAVGNELTLTRADRRTNLADPADYLATLVTRRRNSQTFHRALLQTSLAERILEVRARSSDGATTRHPARWRAQLPVASDSAPVVARALYEVAEWWDGTGPPLGLRGDDISLPGSHRASGRGCRWCSYGAGGHEHAVRGDARACGLAAGPNDRCYTFATNAGELLGEDVR